MTQPSTESKQLQTIALQYPCFICKEVFATPIDVKSHVICVHHYTLPDMPSEAGKTRPAEDNVEFKDLPDSEEDAKEDIKIHSACPSCWFHCPARDMLEFEVHIIEAHGLCSIDTSQEQSELSSNVALPKDIKEENKEPVTQPTVKDLCDKLDDLKSSIRAYLGRK